MATTAEKSQPRHHEFTLGAGVTALVNPGINNGADTAPAIITALLGQDQDGRQLVAARVFCAAPGGDLWFDQATVYPDETAARDGWAWNAADGQRLFPTTSAA